MDKEEVVPWYNGILVIMEKEMATHFSTLAWRIPWTEEPGGLQSMRSQRVGHDLVSKQKQFVLEEKNSAICRDMVWLSNYETILQSEVSPKEKKTS